MWKLNSIYFAAFNTHPIRHAIPWFAKFKPERIFALDAKIQKYPKKYQKHGLRAEIKKKQVELPDSPINTLCAQFRKMQKLYKKQKELRSSFQKLWPARGARNLAWSWFIIQD